VSGVSNNTTTNAVTFEITAPEDAPKAEQEMHKFLDELDVQVVNVTE